MVHLHGEVTGRPARVRVSARAWTAPRRRC